MPPHAEAMERSPWEQCTLHLGHHVHHLPHYHHHHYKPDKQHHYVNHDHKCDHGHGHGTDSHLPQQNQQINYQYVDGVLIIGAGPSGLATATCLERLGVPYLILEREGCIASLWKKHTYDRLHLHTAKNSCQLPFFPMPESYPTFITRQQFVEYLEMYAAKLSNKPVFNQSVEMAKFSKEARGWIVEASCMDNNDDINTKTNIVNGNEAFDSDKKVKKMMKRKVVYVCKWLVVATGENAEAVVPKLPGVEDFKGPVLHSREYKNGSHFHQKKVLVVGAGNSGMEIALDLADCGAKTSIVVRSPVHVLPREMFWMSTFSVAMALCKVLPVRVVDSILVKYSQIKFGDTFPYGLKRPKVGPLELKNKMGKTPILDVGTLSKIQSGLIQVKPAIDGLTSTEVRFIDNSIDKYDAIILATGYKSTVPRWLHDEDNFFSEQGLPRSPLQNWKGEKGLYAAGLAGKGVLGATMDAQQIAKHIREAYFSTQQSSIL